MTMYDSDDLESNVHPLAMQPVRTVVRFRLPSLRWALVFPVAALLAAGFLTGTGYRYRPFAVMVSPNEDLSEQAATTTDARASRGELRRLTASLSQRVPRGRYIVIDRTNNKLYLRQDDKVVLEASCSAGSGLVLREESGKKRSWIFDTPRGRYRVLSKTKNPVWRKPDWAFVEEGQPIPNNPADRIEYGTLGEFALHFGDGYMIHGTLYERLLGRNVSHGCVRLGRDDLRVVYDRAPVGTPIYVY